MRLFFISFFCTVIYYSPAQNSLQKFEPVSFSRVSVTDNFWKPKMHKVATATLQACIYQTEVKTPRIRNFEKVARKKGEKHEGIYFDDSDVYKALEAMAYSLKNHPNRDIEKKADEWIDKIAEAQLPDGYLNTYFTLTDLSRRWTDMEKHEDYCAGHLIEAAVAYYNTTGKRKLLQVATRFADHIDSTFRLKNQHWVSGHQEIELALMKLFHLTKNDRYLKLATWFLEQRGRGYGKGVIWDEWKDPKYCQDDLPVKDQKQITGHAVRAMYLYTGAADVAAVTGDEGYLHAMNSVWEDVVYRNMYITGGIGSSGSNEGFSIDYDLPNENAYCETCASVGMVFWNQRMNLLTGDSKYIDVLEKSLYNGALDGLSLSGDRFFYGNPLASRGQHYRREWFGTACCPSNIARLVSSIGDYIYTRSDNGVCVNLFIGNNTTVKVANTVMGIKMKTNYPWDGKVSMTFNPSRKINFTLYIRIPGWITEQAAPGNLYKFTDRYSLYRNLKINGKDVAYTEDKGYAVVSREWKKGDEVEIEWPMHARIVTARDEVKATIDRVAIQRGPIVYCVEGADNNGQVWNIIYNDTARIKEIKHVVAGEQVVGLQAEATVVSISSSGKSVQNEKKIVTAIPYYTWANRGQNPMQVWLPTRIRDVKLNY